MEQEQLQQQGEASANPSLALYDMLRVGASFSGRERHCAFLNTRDGRFADISAVSGFDLPEDGRGLVRCDWDQDGDEDLWVSARSGPMLRYFSNEAVARPESLALRLESRQQNRDAIGARVELFLEGLAQPLRRDVVAGDAFLSQSSPWLVFGLGPGARVERALVHWPGAEPEFLGGLAAGGRYRLRQGTGQAQATPERSEPPRLESPAAHGAPATSLGVDFLTEAVPLPRLRYEGFDAAERVVDPSRAEGGTLVNLWSSDCAACVRELGEWAQRAPELRAAGLEVVALSLDGLLDGRTPQASAQREAAVAEVRALVERLQLPFEVGLARPALMETVRVLRERIFPRYTPLALPTTLLLDREGRLSSIASGPLSCERAIEDARHARDSAEQRRARSNLFEGRWLREPPTRRVQLLVSELLEAGLPVEAADMLELHAERLQAEPQFARFAAERGLELLEQEEHEPAITFLRASLAARPRNERTRFNLAVALERVARPEEAISLYRELLARAADDFKSAYNLGALLQQLGRYPESLEPLEQAAAAAPTLAEAHARIAEVRRRAGQLSLAKDELLRAAELCEQQGDAARAEELRQAAGLL